MGIALGRDRVSEVFQEARLLVPTDPLSQDHRQPSSLPEASEPARTGRRVRDTYRYRTGMGSGYHLSAVAGEIRVTEPDHGCMVTQDRGLERA